MFASLPEFHEWFAGRSRVHRYRVERVPLAALDQWYRAPETGNLGHRSGKFYTVEGLRVRTDHREVGEWSQPIIVQPEIGILGILVKRFQGVPHCLMQAKMEPGNVNLIQVSPTVQATRSNYTRVHHGAAVPYLEHFRAPRRGRVIFDALQSEQGSWFLNKRNRNLIVEVDEDVEPHEDYCWLTVAQLRSLLTEPNLVNMDSRTVLSGMPFLSKAQRAGATGYGRMPARERDAGALHTTEQALSWFCEAKSAYQLDRRRIALDDVKNWLNADDEIAHERGLYFSVIGVDVQASNREVSHWSQPMLAPRGRGVVAFLGRWLGDVFHVLVQARTEAGTADVVEMSPTVNCAPENYRLLPRERWPRYLDAVLSARPSSLLVDVVHSEEGGRFFHAENRYVVVDVGDSVPLRVPDDYLWMSVPQLTGFVRYGSHVSVGARSLLTCLERRIEQRVAG
ncbi:NDP-hexose 2,3-dehydratase family protein [Dactylosporangium sp. AC04546]|uniref:NDP-hexose 2,3-dehydratase family protein n=1 Tax=Dactylosporangium sp. AC04546 TaxID=2862460 RepID=UPI001EDE8558|nr:NDP-hexose 2,3-dehydratase family protein [Dactylosporangium sp. AC04546]WVK79044.1 NDP-hexose 2,3-dehydratase family protein [Dactylosporangium sp. AC04546]